MPERRLPVVRRLTRAAVALALCLRALSLSAQAVDATVQRLADIAVELYKIDYLWNSRQLDDQGRVTRRTPLENEQAALQRTWSKLPNEDRFRKENEVAGLVRIRLATLEPQLKKEADDLEAGRERHKKDVLAAIPGDVRTALESQRRRLAAQQHRDRGEITPDEFAAEDKKALDEIMALRGKYAAEGDAYAERFDTELRLLTEAAASAPDTPIPVSRVPLNGGGTSDADFVRDVALARTLDAEASDANVRRSAGQLSSAAEREISNILGIDRKRLVDKWRAAGRGDAFERAYQQPPAAPDQQGLRVPEPQLGLVATALQLGKAVLEFVFVVGVIVAIVGLMFRRRPAPERPRVSGIHGTAQFAPLQLDLADEACLQKGVFLGRCTAPRPPDFPVEPLGAPFCTTPEHHTLIVARTRTGKGTRVIIPTLLRYTGSMLIIDPKGENAAVTARSRRDQLGHSVFIVNPWGELAETYKKRGLQPAGYNPLDVLDREDPNVVAVAQTLAGAICPSADPKDRFWQGSAASILTAVLLWLTDQGGEHKTLGRARAIISLGRKDLTQRYLALMSVSDAFGGAIREMAAPFIDMADNTYSGVMAALSENTRFLSDPQIKAATETSTFTMDALVNGQTTVYLVIPPERIETQRTWLRLMPPPPTQTFKRLRPVDRPDPAGRCLFLIDEFPALGHLETLPRDIATLAGYGIDLALVVQDLNQLKTHYGDAQHVILSNCAYKWFCNVSDLETAKWLSEAMGKATVGTVSRSENESASTRSQSEGRSVTYAETGRSLFTPDELLNLGREMAICLQPTGFPQLLRPVDYWKLAGNFAALQEGHPQLYWDPPMDYDQNPYASEGARVGTPGASASRA